MGVNDESSPSPYPSPTRGEGNEGGLTNLKNPTLTANLCAEAAVDAGESIDLHTTVFSLDQRGTFKPLETKSAGNTGAHGRHVDR